MAHEDLGSVSSSVGDTGERYLLRRETVARAAERWAKDLTDESGRNLLLYYRELKTGTLSLDDARADDKKRLLSGKKVRVQKLFAEDRVKDALRRVRAVKRKATVNYEEKGISTLFLGWGMATWTSVSSSAKPMSPVLLCPVDLQPTGAAEMDFDMRLSGDWTLNEALLQHLANEFKVDVSGEHLMDPYGDGEQISEAEERAIFAELQSRADRVPNFDITESVVLGNFMFRKMPMVSDINNNLDALAQHDLIAAIAGDEAASEAVRSTRAEAVDPSLPDRIPPGSEFLVLDADASQNAAVNAALAEESFVLQGPPGTGKSQTISNLIAVMMAEGKSVLFVAEKRAAIEAVVKRLKRVGLGGFVMDLHGGVSSRRDFARQLDQSLREISDTLPVDQQVLHQSLQAARAELSGYAEALHQVREPWKLSYFQVQSRLLGLEASGTPSAGELQPALLFSSGDLADLDEDTAQTVRRDLRDWADLSEPLFLGRSPWARARVTTDDEARRALDLSVKLANEWIPNWKTQQRLLSEELEIDDLGSIGQWSELVAEVVGLADDIAKTESTLTKEVFSRDLERLAEDMAPAGGSVFGRLFNKQYKKAKAELESLASASPKLGARDAMEAIVAARAQTRRWSELGWAGSPRVPAHVASASSALDELLDSVKQLTRYLPEGRLVDETPDGLSRLVQELSADQQVLFRLPRLAEVDQRLRDVHLGPLLERVEAGTHSAAELELAFEDAWLRSIQREVLLSDDRLSGFQGIRQSRYAEEFRQVDAEHLESTAGRVARRIAEDAVAALSRCPDEEQLVRKEATKKTRHLPLRRLFEEAPTALMALRPCWAMSPLDVAQTLPPQQLFDLVVFDEASQVIPCDAISALFRGRRAMVAGDSRQLPPTSFFEDVGGGDDLDEDEESIADYESILDVMDARLSRRPLTWHYRSQDERLIAYSNQEIYHGSLTTFPGAAVDRCLDWVMVPHQLGKATEKGSNSAEVQRVVDLMIDHARVRPTESLGVIAMGRHHADRIQETLRERIEREQSLELEEFFRDSREEKYFVKNLERVQGDERDAIILSIGYGKNANGRMIYRFGPLNQEGGERRLNVAITRARKRMTLVSSFDYADMDPDRTRSRGVNMLRGFLKFAQSGGAELDGAEAPEQLNPFEIDVLDKLEAAGLDVVPQYGCSGYRIDFAVRHPSEPGQFVLAVEADGASYHSSPTARDRDRLRQEHLERLGWRFCRIWSTDWFNDHQSQVRRVRTAYEQALEEVDSEKVSAGEIIGSSGVPSYETNPQRPANSALPLPQRTPKPSIPYHYDLSIDDYSRDDLVAIARWIESDGLLRTDTQLFEEIFEQLPFGRRGNRIRTAINGAIASVRKQQRE